MTVFFHYVIFKKNRGGNTKKNNKKKGKKGFTLVELLAVIVILAIVVGISITTILPVMKNSRKKALQVAADSLALWIDQQYELYLSGVAINEDINEEFINACFGESRNCTTLPIVITADFVRGAGLKADNFHLAEEYNITSIPPNLRWNRSSKTRIYINPNTGKSCVSLMTKDRNSSIDFPQENIVCGGVCQSSNRSVYTFCKEYSTQ